MTINVAQSLALFAASLGLFGSLALPASARLVLETGETTEVNQDFDASEDSEVSQDAAVGEDAAIGENAHKGQNCLDMFLRSTQRDEVICPLPIDGETRGNLQDGGATLYDGTFYHLHAIEGTAGQHIEIQLRSEGFAPMLTVLTVDEERWLSAMIGGGDPEGGYEARTTVTLPETGPYIMMISHQSRDIGGAYELILRSEEAVENQTCAEVFLRSTRSDETICTMAINSSIQRRLQEGDPTRPNGSLYHFHAFEGTDGQRLNIQIESSGFLPALLVMTADEEKNLVVLTAGGDPEIGYAASYPFTLSQTGMYLVWISAAHPWETGGDYTLSLYEVDRLLELLPPDSEIPPDFDL